MTQISIIRTVPIKTISTIKSHTKDIKYSTTPSSVVVPDQSLCLFVQGFWFFTDLVKLRLIKQCQFGAVFGK